MKYNLILLRRLIHNWKVFILIKIQLGYKIAFNLFPHDSLYFIPGSLKNQQMTYFRSRPFLSTAWRILRLWLQDQIKLKEKAFKSPKRISHLFIPPSFIEWQNSECMLLVCVFQLDIWSSHLNLINYKRMEKRLTANWQSLAGTSETYLKTT